MGLNISEQETTVSFMRDSDICTVYTSDSTVMTKLDKLAESEKNPHWKLIEEHRLQSGELVGKTYQTHKRLISFRADIITREMTDEQKEAAAERMKEWQEKKRQEKNLDKEQEAREEEDDNSKYETNGTVEEVQEESEAKKNDGK